MDSAEQISMLDNLFTAASINNLILVCGVIATLMAIRSAKKAAVDTLKHNREIARQTALHSREIAKQTETALFMFHSRSDRNLISGYKTIRDIHRSDTDSMVSYASNDDKRKTREADKIRYTLNFWERVAVCVRHGIYCEEILKDSMYTTVTDVFQRAQPYINEVRIKNASTAYQEFEEMVLRWRSNPLLKKQISGSSI